MKSITRNGAGNESQVEFKYNPFGQRILKIVKPRVAGIVRPANEWIYTYYSYDANGQVMAVYDVKMSSTLNVATLDEQHIYGASRLGMIKPNLSVSLSNVEATTKSNYVGKTYFEINNYLGNVNAVITDRRIANLTPSSSNPSKWEAVVINTSDYYPYGMQMPNRSNSYGAGVAYRYAYNGMETDGEVSGNGNSYTTEFRQYDPRLGRWLSLDPLMAEFPHMSPYNAFNNNPIIYDDPAGDSPISILAKWILKNGAKAALKKYAKNNIERRLKKYMKGNLKSLSKELANDLDELLETLDSEWWEVAIEFVPVVGDAYGATTFGKRIAYAWRKMQDIENKYVEKVYNNLPKAQAEKFKKHMRNAGVRDARNDQKNGIKNGDEYKGDGTVDGHHKKPVVKNPDKMSDPSNIEMMKKDRHMELHKNDKKGGNTKSSDKKESKEKTQEIEGIEVSREKYKISYEKPSRGKI